MCVCVCVCACVCPYVNPCVCLSVYMIYCVFMCVGEQLFMMILYSVYILSTVHSPNVCPVVIILTFTSLPFQVLRLRLTPEGRSTKRSSMSASFESLSPVLRGLKAVGEMG